MNLHALWIVALAFAQHGLTASTSALPSQSVLVEPLSFAVLGANGTFRSQPRALFNPTNTTPPFFQIFDESFLDLLPQQAFIKQVAANATFPFAFEAPIFDPSTNEVFFASSVSPPESSLNHTNRISKISMTQVEQALKSGEANINVPVTTLDLPATVQITNGGTGPFKGSLLLATRGRGSLPSSLVLANPRSPFNTTVLVDNFFGRQFNSMNDVKVHPHSGRIFFTDPGLGFIAGQKTTPPELPAQVYSFNPATGLVQTVADQFVIPNGIAFGDGGKIAFIGDAGVFAAVTDQTQPATIYAYDVDPESFTFSNRRIFAFVDSGIPDGIQVDTEGNVFAGTADGVTVWNKNGVLIGKIFIGENVANMAFAEGGRLVILANTSIFVASVKATSNLVVS
ncbi:calcium-dependent phosphotriesterase [Cyathus striatus]|nr:calcium-dependent phosphotriesterase [Cyathus striatus]